MRQLEDRFNRNYNYPYVFLNNEPFTKEFINFTKAMTKAKIEYGLVPKEYWDIPNDIDLELFNKNKDEMVKIGLPRGGSLSYRFTLVLYEEMITIPTLWDTVKNFIRTFPHSIENDSIIEFITDDNGETYNLWGDAPIHTIAAALFLKKHQVHFFEEIGYHHRPFLNCPKGNKFQHKCLCNPDDSMGEYFIHSINVL
ncbi:4184_t:CDS:2 [Gigaspora margarita]|uniref:4184_t:CDS:1 n=1 Tax=Gigaspora margarita TaxID=4874 RepID=A0ABN7V755_GIGMA|nr:4184_t:CDS:2 [Gigaspora margarita]